MRKAKRRRAAPREHLWFSLPVRCWCGEEHVYGVDDEDFSDADDGDAPDLDERIERRQDDEGGEHG